MNETLWYFNKYNSSRPDACVLNAPYQVMLLTVMNHSLFQLKRDGKFRWYQTWALYTSGNKDPDEVLNNQNKISHSMQRDDLLWGLIESGHIAIFQWAAVWVASGIGLIQMIIEILRMQTLEYFSLGVFVFIYLVLISLMTFSIYNILKIMHLQNGWANQFPEELRTIFYASRSESSNRIVGNRNTMSTRERILIALHLIVFLVFLVIILVF